MFDRARVARAIREFLEDPSQGSCFDAFYSVCFHLARSYLAGLGRRGYRLPLEQYAADTALNDCTIDCLITLFACEPGRPYFLIREYLLPKIDGQTPDEQVVALLQGLVAGHMRQELLRLKKAFDPQTANLRRLVRRVMQGDEYEESERNGHPVWRWRGGRDGDRADGDPVDTSTLRHWTLKAVQHHTQMPDRCRVVFAQLDADDRFQNFLISYRFEGAIIDVLGDHSDAQPSGGHSPRFEYILRQVRRFAEQAVADTAADILSGLAAKRALTVDEQLIYVEALSELMSDLAESGDHDRLPQYIKDEIGPERAGEYLTRHKYIWDTLVADCKERLCDRLRAAGLAPLE
ncbi:MAG TPA: hypothetical protein VM118_12025 [Acidobacteriota bacterium]|nr:hypothetical protein [Acidobacteriota bacterium]